MAAVAAMDWGAAEMEEAVAAVVAVAEQGYNG